MAIVRGAGTEIIRAHHFESVNTLASIIVGEQHHIYTVLSIIIYHRTIAETTSHHIIRLEGFDAYGAASGQENEISRQVVSPAFSTFVWNDKFSFNGFEPDWTSGSGPISVAAEQNLIADQAGGTRQAVYFLSNNTTNYFDVHVTFIDQNNE